MEIGCLVAQFKGCVGMSKLMECNRDNNTDHKKAKFHNGGSWVGTQLGYKFKKVHLLNFTLVGKVLLEVQS